MTSTEARQIEYDVVSDDLIIHLTRMLRSIAQDQDTDIQIICQTNLINRSRTILGVVGPE